MCILVTGGAGFIGSHFVHFLVDETDHEIVTLDALTYAGSLENLSTVMGSDRHHFVEGDVCDRALVTELVGDADRVVNFAAETHVDRSIEGPEEFVRTNVEGTQTLLDAVRESDVEKFIQISTDEVYGEALDGHFSEEDRLNPRNPYAATKAGADLLARSFYVTYGTPVSIIRPSNNFGPRQHPEKLIPKLITRAANDEPLPLYGDGSNVREWLYVEDNCRAIETVLREGQSGEIYNVSSGAELTNLEVARRIVQEVGASEELIQFVDDRPGHDRRYAMETRKVEKLGWESKWSFGEGLAETVEFVLDGTPAA